MQSGKKPRHSDEQKSAGVQHGVAFDGSLCKSLYVGNLNEKITEPLLQEVFSTIGPVASIKLIRDRVTGKSLGYGFVDYLDHQTAAQALEHMNGRTLYGSDMRVNWAFAGSHKEDTAGHFHIFVGDLSPEIDDRHLFSAFSAFGSISDARVMWDQNTGRSRGYGFVAFRNQGDAEQALQQMNGEWLGNRPIRCNWANQKTQRSDTAVSSGPDPGQLDYAAVLAQTPPTNTTVYVGNLNPSVTEQMLRDLFQHYGYIDHIKLQTDKGFAFVKYAAHEHAAVAIVSLHGFTLGQNPIKCSWGKDRNASSSQMLPGGMPRVGGMPAPAMGGYPMMMPQQSLVGQQPALIHQLGAPQQQHSLLPLPQQAGGAAPMLQQGPPPGAALMGQQQGYPAPAQQPPHPHGQQGMAPPMGMSPVGMGQYPPSAAQFYGPAAMGANGAPLPPPGYDNGSQGYPPMAQPQMSQGQQHYNLGFGHYQMVSGGSGGPPS